jgi:hypothetical protein
MERMIHPPVKLSYEQEDEIKKAKEQSNSFLSKLMSVSTSPLAGLEMKNPLDAESDNYTMETEHNQMTQILENNLKLPASYRFD